MAFLISRLDPASSNTSTALTFPAITAQCKAVFFSILSTALTIGLNFTRKLVGSRLCENKNVQIRKAKILQLLIRQYLHNLFLYCSNKPAVLILKTKYKSNNCILIGWKDYKSVLGYE